MSVLVIDEQSVVAKNVVCIDEHLVSLLEGEQEIRTPLWHYPRLLHATPKQREHWEFCAGKLGIHWPEIDEDLSIQGILEGRKAFSKNLENYGQ